MREIITLQCPVCKNRLEFSKFCNTCRKHTDHKETK